MGIGLGPKAVRSKEAEELYRNCIKLRDRNSKLRKENCELRKKNQKLLQEQKQILGDADKMISCLRGVQEQIESWNRQDGDFFDSIMPAVQMLYGYISAGDTEGAAEMLKNIRRQFRGGWRSLEKEHGLVCGKKTEKQLQVRDLKDALQRYKDARESYEKTVLYQNLVLPLLCIMADTDILAPDGKWKQEMDEIFRKEGLRAMYCNELPLDDAANRSQFVRMNKGVETPGLFRVKEEQGYELFGNYQGRVKKGGKEDGRE